MMTMYTDQSFGKGNPTRTQEDRDQLKNEICQYQADIFCNAPIASVRVDDVRYGLVSRLVVR